MMARCPSIQSGPSVIVIPYTLHGFTLWGQFFKCFRVDPSPGLEGFIASFAAIGNLVEVERGR
jgi:hypothetical protein